MEGEKKPLDSPTITSASTGSSASSSATSPITSPITSSGPTEPSGYTGFKSGPHEGLFKFIHVVTDAEHKASDRESELVSKMRKLIVECNEILENKKTDKLEMNSLADKLISIASDVICYKNDDILEHIIDLLVAVLSNSCVKTASPFLKQKLRKISLNLMLSSGPLFKFPGYHPRGFNDPIINNDCRIDDVIHEYHPCGCTSENGNN